MIKREKQSIGQDGSERQLSGVTGKVVAVIAITTSLFHVLGISYYTFDPLVFRGATFMFASIMAFLLYTGKKKSQPGVVDMALVVLSAAVFVYILLESKTMIYRAGVMPTNWDIIFGSILLVLVIEMARRTVGWVLPGFALVAIAYTLWGADLPGILSHKGYPFSRMVSYLFGLDAVYGTTLGVVSTYVILFVLFGAFLEVSGGGRLIVDLAVAIAGRSRGGPAKIAVIASSLMGSINGSTIANVATTGSFTIPLMKKTGYRPEFAAAVETAASSGGQIMPPVMGAGAFIMAEMLGLPYATIVTAAFLPALLYYICIYWQVDLEAQKQGLLGLPQEQIPRVREVLRERGHLLLPLIVLIYALLVAKMSAQGAGLLAILSCIVVSWFKRDTRLGWNKILEALEKGGRGIITATAATVAAGIIIGVLSLTGLQVKLGIGLLTYTHGSLWLTLIIAAIFALILGCGQPSVAAYIIAAAIAVPGLTELGIPDLWAHLFVFYFASFSNVTPPVAVAAYVAAAIAKAKPMAVAGRGFILSIAAFIVPFVSIYRPGILWQGGMLEIAHAALFVLIGVIALGAAVEGWLRGKLTVVERGLFLVTAVLSVYPAVVTDVLAAVLFAALVTIRLVIRRPSQAGVRPNDRTVHEGS